MADSGASSSGAASKWTSSRWLTAAIWCIGVGLQFATPLLRGRVPLSDDLFIGSFLAPWWLFLQVALLAGVLAIARRAARTWSGRLRIAFAIAVSVVCMLAQPDLITMAVSSTPLSPDPVNLARAWSTPLFFYVMPAAVVVYAWLRPESRLTTARAVAIGLVIIGVMSFPYIVWLTHLWEVYIRNSGGESVSVGPATSVLG